MVISIASPPCYEAHLSNIAVQLKGMYNRYKAIATSVYFRKL